MKNMRGRIQVLHKASREALYVKSNIEVSTPNVAALKNVANNIIPPVFPLFSTDIDSAK
jgi:hypothetical protein